MTSIPSPEPLCLAKAMSFSNAMLFSKKTPAQTKEPNNEYWSGRPEVLPTGSNTVADIPMATSNDMPCGADPAVWQDYAS